MGKKLNELSVFISSTSADLGDARQRLRRYFESLGAKVFAQGDREKGVIDGIAIEDVIARVTLNVCLVGHRFGTRLPDDRMPGRGHLGAVSWTQWELELAHERYVAERKADRNAPQSLMLYMAEDAFDARGRKLPDWPSQEQFRRNLPEALNDRFGTKFARRFSSVSDLLLDVAATCDDVDGLLPTFQRKRWQGFKELYAERCKADFDQRFRHRLSAFTTKARHDNLRSLVDEVLVDDQKFRVPGRDGSGAMPKELSIQGASGAAGNLTFDELRSALLMPTDARRDLLPPSPRHRDQSGLRIVLTSASGLGKTTTMQRLEAELNDEGHFAVLFTASKLRQSGANTHANIRLVIDPVLSKLEIDWDQLGFPNDPAERARLDKKGSKYGSPAELVAYGLQKEADAGTLTLLVDALDQVDSVPPAFVRLQGLQAWARTNVVLAGRPRSIERWHGDGSSESLPDIRHWAVVIPLPFDDEQAKAYLGGVQVGHGQEWRYSFVSHNLGPLKYHPRVLRYLRSLDHQQLSGARTASALYHRAVRILISDALSSSRQRRPDKSEVDRLLQVLACLAFESLFEGPAGLRIDSRTAFDLETQQHAKDLRLKRLAHLYPAGRARAGYGHDWAEISRMATLVDNGVFDPDTMLENSNLLAWSSVTIQHFLAALWLATHPRPSRNAKPDDDEATWFRSAIFYPYARNGDATEEINRFLSEMPAEAIDYESWVAAARAWYDPSPASGVDKRAWSTEMIARSWRMMHDLAGRDVDDWWDISYDRLCQSAVGHRVGVHKKSVTHVSRGTRDAAAAALDGFLGDFQRQLDAGDPVASEFAHHGWQDVPGGSFRMGSPRKNQGFPPRTEQYWRDQIIKAGSAETKDDLRKLAEETSPKSWWSGPYGDREWEAELEWLTKNVFLPYQRAVRSGSTRVMLPRILAHIESNFRRPDETPKDKGRQRVAPFELKDVPTTFEVFGLFSPGHVEAVAHVIAPFQTGDYPGKVGKEPIPKAYAPSQWNRPERPAIYISWYDAWAFSQWARWKVGDAQFRCRLPHEPEWEHACKQPGEGQPFRWEQKYWWGDEFYADYFSVDEEAKSTPEAHAVGWPGATRDPKRAEGNGLGLKDMIGNVWEWCANIYDPRSEEEVKEDETSTGYTRFLPVELPTNNAPRSMRGGIWYYKNHVSTAASRFRLSPNDADFKTGFRLVRERL